MDRKKYLIERLGLEDEVENGLLRGFFPSSIKIPKEIVKTKRDRLLYSFAYYMLIFPNYGPFHALEEVATWQVIEGCSIRLHLLFPSGKYECVDVGLNIEVGQEFIYHVPQGVWQAAELLPDQYADYSLISHFVIPSFDYSGRVKGTKELLSKVFPDYLTIINSFAWKNVTEKITSVSSGNTS